MFRYGAFPQSIRSVRLSHHLATKSRVMNRGFAASMEGHEHRILSTIQGETHEWSE